MLSCQEMTELVTDYLEKRLTLRDRIRFRLHLGVCRHCRAYLEQMRTTVRLLGRLPSQEEGPAVPDALLRRFASWKEVAPELARGRAAGEDQKRR
jgi:predicted anti-sigma-YlaC factor YlaD